MAQFVTLPSTDVYINHDTLVSEMLPTVAEAIRSKIGAGR